MIDRGTILGVLIAGWLGLAAWQGVVLAAEPIRIGYIDAQKILDNTELGRKAKADLEEYRQSRQRVLELDQQDLREMEASLAKQADLLSPEAKRQREAEYQKKLERFQRKLLEMNREIETKMIDLLQDFRRALEAATRQVAERSGYDLVLDRNAEGGPIVYASERFDLTEQVVQEMNKQKPAQ